MIDYCRIVERLRASARAEFSCHLCEEAAAEIERLREALNRFRDDRERLLTRIEFAAQPIGNCGYCMVGNKPGSHHLPDCKAYRVSA